MTTDQAKPTAPCPECEGRTIEFRGNGRELQYKICSRWKQEGHLDEDEVRRLYAERHLVTSRWAFPSGRQA